MKVCLLPLLLLMQDGQKDPIDIHTMHNQGWESLLASTHRTYFTLVYTINIAQHVQGELKTTHVIETGMRALQQWKPTLL